MGFFGKKKETQTERVDRLIKEDCGKNFMTIDDEWLDANDLDLIYEKGWELISARNSYTGSIVHYFKKIVKQN